MLPNIASMSVSKIRGRRDAIFTYFLTASFIAIYKRPPSRHKTTTWSLSCRGALPALQRGPRGIAVSAPLHCNKAAIATQGGPYGRKTVAFPDIFQHHKPGVFSVLEKL